MNIFFFSSIRRHTRYIGDWSSDVCSSDLDPGQRAVHDLPAGRHRVLLVAPPPGGGLAVEQQAPAGGALGGGQRVERSEERRVGKEGRARGAVKDKRKEKK